MTKQRRRVLHVLTVADSLLFLRGQGEFMRDHGWDISVACDPGTRFDAMLKVAGCEGHPISMARAITPAQDVATVARLVRLIRELRPDIVHAHTPKGGLLGMTAAAIAGIDRRLFHMRGLPSETARGRTRLILTGAERATCGLAKQVVCVSPSLLEVAHERRVLPKRKGVVLGAGSGNGVDSSRFTPPTSAEREDVRHEMGWSGEVVFLFVGRLVGDKGVRELASAWRRVRELVPNSRLVLAGPWEPRDPVPDVVRKELERDTRVEMPGYVSDPRPLYRAADVVVLPSKREGFPNVPLEGAAMQLPVITTMATGCRDSVISGETGFLVPTESVQALVDAMTKLGVDAALRREMGARGRKRVETEFSPSIIWESLLGIYRSWV